MLRARCTQASGSVMTRGDGKWARCLFPASLRLSLPVLTGTLVSLSLPSPSLSALTLIKNVISGQLWIWVSSS